MYVHTYINMPVQQNCSACATNTMPVRQNKRLCSRIMEFLPRSSSLDP